METITSRQNAKVKEWNALKEKKYRDRSGLFLVEEDHLIAEAASAGRLNALIVRQGEDPGFACPETYFASQEVLDKLSSCASSCRRIGVARREENPRIGSRVILLDDVQDPGNAGTILRVACAFGFDTVVFSPLSADPYGPKAVRSSQGALFHLHVVRRELEEAVEDLKKAGIPVCGTCVQGGTPLEEFPCMDRISLVLGNEGSGMKEKLQKMCDRLITIPMSGFESLNVAVSAGIIAYHFRKRESR